MALALMHPTMYGEVLSAGCQGIRPAMLVSGSLVMSRCFWLLLACFVFTAAPAFAQFSGKLPGLEVTTAAAAPPKPPQVLGVSEDDQATREKLRKRITTDWIAIKLHHAVESLQRELDVQIQLDPEGLEEADVAKDQEIARFACRERRGDHALKLLLEPLHMTYIVRHGVVIVTSEEKAAEQLTTRLYNVRDLLDTWPPPEKRAVAVSRPFPVPEGTQVRWPAAGSRGEDEYIYDADTLIDLITSTVAPDSWTDNGGSGSMSVFRGLLVVSQSDDLHDELNLMLRQLRAGEQSQPGDVIVLSD